MAVAGGEGLEKLEDMIVRAAESTAAHIRSAKAAISAVIFGQERVVERALVTVLSGGHALLVGVPGLAKTKLVDTMGTVLGLDARRIQFTPDLMPSDILGSEVLEESPGAKRTLRLIPGPIFAQLLMADEVNRAHPPTQSGLLPGLPAQPGTRAGAEGDETAKLIAWGPSPRASQALMLGVRARALLEGRFAPSIDDVVDLAEPILKHRMALTFAARADGETIEAVVGRLRARIG